MTNNKMHCPEDGASYRSNSNEEIFYSHYPKKEEMQDVTKEFSIIPDGSKYEIRQGSKEGYHSEWNDETNNYQQVQDKDDYYAIYYDGKKVDDFVAPSVSNYAALMNSLSMPSDNFKHLLDRFNVETLIVDDYVDNHRKGTLEYTAYLNNNLQIVNAGYFAQAANPERVLNVMTQKENKYEEYSKATEIVKLATFTCFTPNKDEKYYKNIFTAGYYDALQSLEAEKEKGMKKFKMNVSRLYSCVKTISFAFVGKKIFHENQNMAYVQELCLDALKLNQVNRKKIIKADTLQKAILALPEMEHFNTSKDAQDTFKNIFKAAETEFNKEKHNMIGMKNYDAVIEAVMKDKLGILLPPVSVDNNRLCDILVKRAGLNGKIFLAGHNEAMVCCLYPIMYKHTEKVSDLIQGALRHSAACQVFSRWKSLPGNYCRAKSPYKSKIFMRYLDDIGYFKADYLLIRVE